MIKNQDFKRNLHIDDLIKDAVENKEGVIGLNGALMVDTGEFSGRIPNDKFIVDEDSSSEDIWWGEVNQKLSQNNFDYLLKKVLDTYENLSSSYYVFDGFAGDDSDNSLNVRMITKKAWQSLFVNNMFIRPSKEQLNNFSPDFTIINAYDVKEENWDKYGLNSENFMPSKSALSWDNKKTKIIEDKIISLKNVESSLTKYNPLKATPVEGSNKARINAIIIMKIPNLFVFLKLFSLKKNMSNIINIKVEQKIKISGIAKSNPSMPGICK